MPISSKVKRFGGLILIALAIAPSHAFTEKNTGWFLRLYADGSPEDRQMVETYLSNNQNGFHWANEAQAMESRPKLYCAPTELTPTGGQLLETVRLQVKADPRTLLIPFGFALLLSMQTTYPCKFAQ
ncbi:hypothetical protein [Bradyrhizobium ivorense]|uniref:hypothetical protein n=2 Tax=Bradyrhizobium TaxID=374 RepID=UPI001116054E|nr:hypothetical protein [Bradyrhizobium ivorense]